MLKNTQNRKSFLGDNSGNVIIMTALAALILFAIAGAGVDFGRAYLVKNKAQQASDQAALAAANLPTSFTPVNAVDLTAKRNDAALRYYNLNFPATYMDTARVAPAVSITDSNVSVNSNALNVKTNFINSLTNNNTIVAKGKSLVDIAGNSGPDFDVVMVIDESGSTRVAAPSGGGLSVITVEKNAITTMLGVLFPTATPNPNLRFGLVGYSGAVVHAFGLTSNKAQAQTYVNALDYYFQNYDNYGLEAGLNMITGVWNGFVPPTYCPIHSNHANACAIPSILTATPAQLATFMTCLIAANDCAPEQNTGVPAAVTARSDGNQLSNVKNVVFITDGYIMEEPCGFLAGGASNSAACYPLFLASCDAIKASGATLYTISFVSQSVGDATTLQACASDPTKYYFAPDGATLQSILTVIGTQIRKLRIVD